MGDGDGRWTMIDGGMNLHAARTGILGAAFLDELRGMLVRAYDGDFDAQDWQHLLGGVHVWVSDSDGRVISHASIVERTIVCAGHALRTGYVEAVATMAEHRARGCGTAVMRRVADLVRAEYDLGALSTGEVGFYQRLGWELWRGPTSVESPEGRRRTTEDDGDVMVLRTPRTPALDLDAEIACDWRQGDVW
jgi:aminoglycoside 2'-N-acetyltransferase I